MTKFAAVYNRFLGKITDDMYVELTPQDTIRDLRALILEAIPGFEFPLIDLYAYTIQQEEMNSSDTTDEDFILGVAWDEIAEMDGPPEEPKSRVIVENSFFDADLSSEEINILAILMMEAWLQRQVTSIENTRMKYSGTDFKMTSQANHLSKLQSLLGECQRQSIHMQRLYKRRRFANNGHYESNWKVFRRTSYYD